MKRARFAQVVGVAMVLAAGEGGAIDIVTRPYPCVEHLHRRSPGTDAHVVVVDLTCGQIDVVATRPQGNHSTVSTFATEYGAQIAINANFFEQGPCGVAMGDGELWRSAYMDRCGASVAFAPSDDRTRVLFTDTWEFPRMSPTRWARQVVTGWPTLLREGSVVFEPEEPIGMYRYHPRTAIGATPGGQHLVIAVIDGRRSGLPGATSLDMIPLMEEFGVSDAINLDGGGSSALFIEREGGVVNRPSDRIERAVANHLGVRITSARSETAQ